VFISFPFEVTEHSSLISCMSVCLRNAVLFSRYPSALWWGQAVQGEWGNMGCGEQSQISDYAFSVAADSSLSLVHTT